LASAQLGLDDGEGGPGLSWTIESVREADVDAAAVLALYADPSAWSSWGHNAAWARAAGPLVEGEPLTCEPAMDASTTA